MNARGITLVLAFAASTAAAQVTDNNGSASLTYFSDTKTTAPSGSSGSATYALRGTIGDQAPAKAGSATYGVAGGFLATLEPVPSVPWLTAARPTIVGPKSSDLVWLRGTRLTLGGTPTVTVSGRAATVVAESPTDVAIRMPALPTPGWHEVRLSTTTGTTVLERGLGVLPIVYTEGAAASDAPFDLIFKGTRGDVVIWALGFNPGPVVRVNNFLHGLTINTSFVRILPSFPITDPSGEVRLNIPPVPFRFAIYFQALFSTSNPDYAPGSFSNMLIFK